MTKEELNAYLDCLGIKPTEREMELLTMRFGLEDGEPKSLEEVAQHFGITRERVRQIENKLLVRHRPPKRAKKIADYYK